VHEHFRLDHAPLLRDPKPEIAAPVPLH